MPTRHHLCALVVLPLAILASSTAAAQCSCEKADRQASLNASDIVFWGKASLNDDGKLIFRVSKSLKGTRYKRRHTLVPKDDCDASFEEGTYYIVFADKEKKRDISVSSCRATQPLPKSPFTATAWSAADQLPYGVSRREARRHQVARDRLNGRALDKTRYAARKCDDGWKADDKARLDIQVRFDVQPDGEYQATVLSYASPTKSLQEISVCLAERLDGKKFRKFRGNAVSVKTRWIIDRVDASLKQEKKSATVVPYEGSEARADEEDDSEKTAKK